MIDNGEYAIGIYLDLKKAFDTVHHDILLKKLEHYGIRGQANTLISNYLTNRTQYWIVNGRNPSIGSICTGVPQDSVLGPLLFLLYINDIASSMTDENLILFADDTLILFHDKNLKSLLDKAKSSLTKIQSWLLSNKLEIVDQWSTKTPPPHRRGWQWAMGGLQLNIVQSHKVAILKAT